MAAGAGAGRTAFQPRIGQGRANGAALSGGMHGDEKASADRETTDESLRSERQKADRSAGAKRSPTTLPTRWSCVPGRRRTPS